MKKIICSILSILIILGFSAFADEQTDIHNGEYYIHDLNGNKAACFIYDVTNGGAIIRDVKVYKNDIDLVFPAKIKDYPVKSVSGIYFTQKDEKFRDKIKTIVFEDGIEIIDKCSFDFAKNLTSLQLPNTLKNGDFNFRDCTSLEYVTIPYTLKEIPEMCFFGCTNLKEVNIENGVQIVGDSAFEDCKNMSSIHFPDSILYIKRFAFKACEDLTNVNLSKNLEYIGDYAFYQSGIEQIKFPSGLKEIGEQAFGITPLKEIKLPDSLESIGYEAFKECRSLTKAYIPKAIMNKPNNAFYNCSGLSDITFDGEITKELYDHLTKWTPWGKEYAQTISDDFVIFDGNYLAAYNGTDKNPVIPDKVTILSEQAFQNADIDTVTFSTNIKEIPPMCFAGSHIKELVIPSTVQNIQEKAFYRCLELKKIFVEEGVKSISSNAFQMCHEISEENVNIAKSVHVSSTAFSDTPLDKMYAVGGQPTEKPQATAEPSKKPEILTVNGGDTIAISVGNNAVKFPDAQPFVDDNGRTQVPIRAVSEMLDCKVDWNGENKTASITLDNGDVVMLTLDSDIMTVNDKPVQMDTAALIKNDRTYIPVRFVAEALGLMVEWVK